MSHLPSVAALRASLPSGAVIFNESVTLVSLRLRLSDLQARALSIQATADAEARDFTAQESGELDDIFMAIEKTKGDVSRRETIDANDRALTASRGRQVGSTDPGADGEGGDPARQPITNAAAGNGGRPGGAPSGRVPAMPIDSAERRRHGFSNMGEFSRAVVGACRPGGGIDPRLVIDAPTTFGSEGVGADGGFAVPPEFRTAIMEKVTGEDSLLARCDLMETTGNTLVIPTDETTPWQTTGGIQAYWEGEGQQLSQTKPQLQDTTLRLNKLTALVPVTSELLEDAAALASYINRKAPDKIDMKVNVAILNGTGTGQPLGILQSPALVTVNKETSQAAATVSHANVVKMWGRLYAGARPNAIWLINQDVEQSLNQMGFPSAGTTLQFPMYTPPGGVSGAPYATLMGRPVVPSQACSTLGTAGDIILTDMKAYLAAQKVGGVRAETSIHLWFDYDVMAFRFILRLAGQPWWMQQINPLNGSNTLSHYVTLATRT